MSALYWIILGGLLMAAIAMVGSVTLLLKPATLDRLLLVLVAFAAGCAWVMNGIAETSP